MAPQSRALPVLLTRPEAQGDRFAAMLRERFGDAVEILSSPLLAPVFLTPDLPKGDHAAVILTSETGVQAARRLLSRHALPELALCVGDRTAQAARAAGFRARSASGDADALLAMILADPPHGPLLHLHGRETRGDLAARLAAAGCRVDAVTVYAQEPQPLSAQARALLDGDGPVVAPLFSPRTAQLFAATAPHRAALWVAALSPAVAAALGDLPVARLVVAPRPDAADLIGIMAPLMQAGHA